MAKEYTADDIRALDWQEHIRLRPSMYFEACFKEKTLDALPFEVLCHAFDEYYDGNCNKIELTIYNDSFSVLYNYGMSLRTMNNELTIAEAIMTTMNTCSNMKKHIAVGEEFCSIGMAAINAASETCKLETVSKQQKGSFVFEKGITIFKKITEIISEEEEYTEAFLKPDQRIFEGLKFTSKGIKEKAEKINSKFKDFEIKIIDKIS